MRQKLEGGHGDRTGPQQLQQQQQQLQPGEERDRGPSLLKQYILSLGLEPRKRVGMCGAGLCTIGCEGAGCADSAIVRSCGEAEGGDNEDDGGEGGVCEEDGMGSGAEDVAMQSAGGGEGGSMSVEGCVSYGDSGTAIHKERGLYMYIYVVLCGCGCKVHPKAPTSWKRRCTVYICCLVTA